MNNVGSAIFATSVEEDAEDLLMLWVGHSMVQTLLFVDQVKFWLEKFWEIMKRAVKMKCRNRQDLGEAEGFSQLDNLRVRQYNR